MRKTYVKILFDRKKKAARKGVGLVEVMIYLSRTQRKMIPVAEIKPEDWPAFSTSSDMQELVRKYEKYLDAMEVLHKETTIESLNEILGVSSGNEKQPSSDEQSSQPTKNPNSFLDFFYDELAAERIDIRTRQAREVVYNSLLKYGKIETFDDLTPAKILEYHKWLQKDGTRKTTTLKHYHKRLHRYVLKAFEYGYISRDPYKTVRIPAGRSEERRPLNEAEIALLRSLHLPIKEERARDLFIFSCFTGLAYSDAQLFDFHTMTEKKGDLYFIVGKRLKTDSTFYTPILEPAMEILKKYGYRLPRISNQKLDDYLHLVESRACLNKPLTSHVARHTFATWVLAHDVPIENVTRMLGQRDVRTTQVYAKILPTSIQRHAETLNQSIKSRPTRTKASPMPQSQPQPQPQSDVVVQPVNTYTYSYSYDNQSLYINL